MKLVSTLDVTTYWLQDLLVAESEIEHAAMSAETWVASNELSKHMNEAALHSVSRATRLRHVTRTLGIDDCDLPSSTSHPVSHPSQAVSIDSDDAALDLAAVSNIRRLLRSVLQLYSDVATHAGRWTFADVSTTARQIADEIAEEAEKLGRMSDTLGEAFRTEKGDDQESTSFGSTG